MKIDDNILYIITKVYVKLYKLPRKLKKTLTHAKFSTDNKGDLMTIFSKRRNKAYNIISNCKKALLDYMKKVVNNEKTNSSK